MSEYIGKDDYSIFNDEDQLNHSPGETQFKTSQLQLHLPSIPQAIC